MGPRKKYRCATPSCENVGMISSAAGHLEVGQTRAFEARDSFGIISNIILQERSRCLDMFLKLYGEPCPLKNVRLQFTAI